MASPAQFLEDAISASRRAVQFDSAGKQEAAAAYFYRVAAQLLEKAAGVATDPQKAELWLQKAKMYKSRGIELQQVEQEQENREIKCSQGRQLLERCYFLLQQGLDADEAGVKETAIELYTQAVELGLKYPCDDAELRDKIKRVVVRALERAEELKGIAPGGERPIAQPRKAPKTEAGKPALHRGFSANLQVSGGSDAYTDEEKRVLLHTSRINSNEFVPFMDIDLSERFRYAIPFSDKDGALELSPKQRKEFTRWVRPEEVCQEPCVILGEHPDYYSIKQTIISDCSFVASLAVSARYERRFGRRLVTSIIYPRSTDKRPIYNPFGKYMVKLHLNGVTRKIIIDDQLPLGKHGQLLCSYSSNRNELWVSLLEKAYMKVMGGYDFPGSNSNIDLHVLTGWIPERVGIRQSDADFNRDSLFAILETRMSKGDVLVTAATGPLTDAEAERTGLVASHAYAVLDARTVFGARLLKLKNPWSHLRWRGNYSELDAKHWTKEMREALNYDPDSAAQFDNGVFWIDYDSICNFYDVFYMNWNPALFHFTYCLHQEWRAGLGPTKDSYNIGSNPQFSLEIDAGVSAGAVWILLTRHITDIEDFRENREFITVLVYKSNGRRIYYPHDPPPYIDGVRINSPHYLCKIILTPNSSKKYTLVVSQYEKTQTIYYTLRAYATCPFKLAKIGSYQFEQEVLDAWKGPTAGGCGNHPQTYKNNPKFMLTINSGRNDNQIFVQLKGPKEFLIGFEIIITSLDDDSITAPFHSKSSGAFRSGFVYMELDNIPSCKLRIIPSTYYPNQEGPFILTAKAFVPIQLARER